MTHPTRRQLLISGLAAGGGVLALTSPACRIISAGPRPEHEYAVGVIGLFPNSGEKYEGELPEVALKAAVAKIDADGGLLGRPVIYRGAQAGTEDEAYEGFRRLESDRTVIGVVLATPLAAERIVDEAAQRGLPLITTASDLASTGGLWPAARDRRSIFQFTLPSDWIVDALAHYAASDRGYRKTALLYDEFTFPSAARQLGAACQRWGLNVVRSEQFGRGQVEIDEQVASFAASAPNCLFVWADPQTTGTVAQALAKAGAQYIDTPTARAAERSNWHPQLFGSPQGMAERDWATVAGDAATTGSITASDIGAFRKGPEWPPEIWGRELAADWERKEKGRRGLRPIVDSVYALVEAARRAGTTDRRRVVEALESGRIFRFASTTFGFSTSDHLALSEGDVALMTLEHSAPAATSPPYSLGTEWKEGLETSPDMTLLLRPRLAQNLEAQREWTEALLSGGFGTQCTREPDGSLSSVCKIH